MAHLQFSSYREYILFLYLHIAFADGVVQDEEKELILDRLKKYFKDPKEPQQKFDEMLVKYQEHKGEVEDIIVEAHNTYTNIEFYKKYKVFKDLYDIIEADGIIEDSETEAFERLKHIIDIETDFK